MFYIGCFILYARDIIHVEIRVQCHCIVRKKTCSTVKQVSFLPFLILIIAGKNVTYYGF